MNIDPLHFPKERNLCGVLIYLWKISDDTDDILESNVGKHLHVLHIAAHRKY